MPDDRYEWVTLREASRRLGRSPETIRRQIRAGTFEHPAEREQRVPGDSRDRYKVRLPMAPDTPQATPREASAVTGVPEIVSAAVEPLERQIGRLEASRDEDARIIANMLDRIADLRERVGRAEAEAEHERARADEAVRRFEAEREKRVAEAGEVGPARADAFIARVERDQAIRELEQARAELARPWYRRIFG